MEAASDPLLACLSLSRSASRASGAVPGVPGSRLQRGWPCQPARSGRRSPSGIGRYSFRPGLLLVPSVRHFPKPLAGGSFEGPASRTRAEGLAGTWLSESGALGAQRVRPALSQRGAVLNRHGVSHGKAAGDQGRARRKAPGLRAHRVTSGAGGAARSGREAGRERAAGEADLDPHNTERRSERDRTGNFRKCVGHNSGHSAHKL